MPEDYSGRDFSNQSLGAVQWEGYNLTRAIFRRADVVTGSKGMHACFKGADLTEADFSFATLPHVNFENARLVGVDFESAAIVYANMQNADLRHAWFADCAMAYAKLQNANLCGADLSKAISLKLARLQGAIYDQSTRWPPKYDPVHYGAVFVEES